MTMCTTYSEGPFLVVCTDPPGTTAEQTKAGLAAAQRVFDEAGIDPVECEFTGSNDQTHLRFLENLWDRAEEAATTACWAPREGTPEPTKLKIFYD
jgi:hypothetical protein